jgi:hypothetical protein
VTPLSQRQLDNNNMAIEQPKNHQETIKIIENKANEVRDKNQALMFLHNYYQEQLAAAKTEDYEKAGLIKKILGAVWKKYEDEISEAYYDNQSGILYESLLDDSGKEQLINYEDFFKQRQETCWLGKETIEASKWRNVLLSESTEVAWQEFVKTTKIDQAFNNLIYRQTSDFWYKLNSYRDGFEQIMDRADAQLARIWHLRQSHHHLPFSPYEDELSFYKEKEPDWSQFGQWEIIYMQAMMYWQTISDNAFSIVSELEDGYIKKIKNGHTN